MIGSAVRRAWRDPWAWLPLLSALPLVLHSLGAPLGEPFADDFYFLRRIVIPGPRPIFDGGGSPVFWRPLGRQAYFGALGTVMLDHPLWVVGLHVALLALSGWLLYRALRPHWPGSAAAVAASFPLLVESGRMLIGWPSHFQDVGAIFFAALALHEASRGRLASTLASLLAALLCKEIAAVTALLVPWMPARPPEEWRSRARWSAATTALLAIWGAGYYAVVRHSAVAFEHEVEPATAVVPLLDRVAWALLHSARAAFSLPARPGQWDALAAAVLVALVLGAIAIGALRREARARMRAARPWAAWGLAWFLLAGASLAETYPSWSAQRGVFGSFGLGLALTAPLAAAHPALLVPLLALKLFLFAASPRAPLEVSGEPPEAGEFDFRHFVRLERVVSETHAALRRRFPTLPRGAIVGQHVLPWMSEHAFAGSNALQVWYRDSTVRWIRFDQFTRNRDVAVVAFVEYQPHGSPQIALVDPEAMRALLAAADRMRGSDWTGALAALDRADEAQRDTSAHVFLGTSAAKRALCLAALDHGDDAERAAWRGLGLWPENPDCRFVLAQRRLAQRGYAEAETLLVTQLTLYPTDRGAIDLLRLVREAWRAEQPGGR